MDLVFDGVREGCPTNRRPAVSCAYLLVFALGFVVTGCLDLPGEEATRRDGALDQRRALLDRGPPALQERDLGPADMFRMLPDLGPPDEVLPYAGCEGDTASLPVMAAGPWGPAGRIVRMDPPLNPAQAAEFGCEVHGHNRGSGLMGLITLLGEDLTQQMQPNEEGEIALLLLAHLEPWPAGRTGGQVGSAALKVYDGDPDPDSPGEFLIDRDSFFDPDELRFLRAEFAATLEGCDLVTTGGDFSLSLPKFYIPGGIRLSRTQVRAHIFAEEIGFSIRSGIITGYIQRETLTEAVVVLNGLCSEADPPEVCAQIGGIIEGDSDDAVDLIFNLLGGADALVRDDVVRGNCADHCNAVSVCVQVRSEPVRITGVSDD